MTATQGLNPDPDGFTLSIDDGSGLPLGASDTLTVEDLAPAEYRVTLSGMADNCTVSGQNPVPAVVVAHLLTTIRFEVDCAAPTGATGALQVIVGTSGTAPDEDGYSLYLDASGPVSTGTTDTVAFAGLAARSHSLRLGGLASNCTLSTSNPRSLTITADAALSTVFDVRCWPPLSGRIVFTRNSTASFTSRIELINSLQTAEEFFFSGADRASRPSWSPDGSRVAYFGVTDDPFTAMTWVNLEPFDRIPLDDCQLTARRPVWSPDGQRVLCLSAGRLLSVDVVSQAANALAPGFVGITSASWSSTGRVAFRVSGAPLMDSIYSVASVGALPEGLFELQSNDVGINGAPAWSPDGRKLAVFLLVPNPDVGGPSFSEIQILDLTTKVKQVAYRGLNFATDLEWSPTGDYLLFDLKDNEFSVQGSVARVGSDGQDLHELVSGIDPSWSPDGSKIVFSQVKEGLDSTGVFQSLGSIFAMNLDGTGITRLTAGGDDREPDWSP